MDSGGSPFVSKDAAHHAAICFQIIYAQLSSYAQIDREHYDFINSLHFHSFARFHGSGFPNWETLKDTHCLFVKL